MRLPILARNDDVISFNKPAGFAVVRDGLRLPGPTLVEALHAAIGEGKPQWSNLGLRHAGCIHGLDAETTGVVLFALHADAESFLRNAVGSRDCEFVFDLIAETGVAFATHQCDLPLAVHTDGGRSVVSRVSGRRCTTTFEPVMRLGPFSRWEARTRDLRPHQIRLHAAESGLRIPGETCYARVPLVFLSALKQGYRPRSRAERPMHAPLCLHLREIEFPGTDGSRVKVAAPLPRSFEALLRRLGAVNPKPPAGDGFSG